MSLPDFLLEASRVLIGLGLAVFVGVPLARSCRQDDDEGKRRKEREQRIFLEGEEGEGERGARPGEVRGGGRASRRRAPRGPGHGQLAAAAPRLAGGGASSCSSPSLVYSVMVVAPKARYYDERSSTFEENLRAPWHARGTPLGAREQNRFLRLPPRPRRARSGMIRA